MDIDCYECSGKTRIEALPIHRLVLLDDFESSMKEVHEYHSSLCSKDYDGNSVIDIIIQRKSYLHDLIIAIMDYLLPIDIVTKQEIPSEKHDYAWIKLVQYDRFLPVIETILLKYDRICKELAYTSDKEGRSALFIASPLCQAVIQESLYFLNRYDIPYIDQPTHKSATSLLYIATDYLNDKKIQVALKFMSQKEQYD